jgi:alpha-D-xyloside xylohydrolase
MPYLTGAARQVQDSGTPMIRPMILEFPDDPATEHLDAQYMLGDSLLVAPVFSADGSVRYYVPEGRWTDLLDGSTVVGPRWVSGRHGFDSLPLLARPGSVIPIGARDDRPDYDYPDGVALHLFGIESLGSTTVQVPALGGGTGSTFAIEHHRDTVTVRRAEGTGAFSVVLPPGAELADCRGGDALPAADGAGVVVRAVSGTVTITLAETPGPTASQEDSYR